VSRASVCGVAGLVIVAWGFAGGRASAQEVRWRADYAAARKEAAETGRPLLLDFGTEACVWCRKLDATTFRDPKIVTLLNERFIPVRIDGRQEARLTAALNVTGFPTLIIATADGRVVGRSDGYADVPQLLALVGKAPAAKPAAPSAPIAPVVPAALIAPPAPPSDEQKRERRKAEFDAGLQALFPDIAAALGR
jgi:thioredoxin-related protein